MCETPDQIISAINALSVPARKELSQKVHNTAEGRAAYVAFNYGMGEPTTTDDTNDGGDNGGGTGGDNTGGGDGTSGGGGTGGNSDNTNTTAQTVNNHYENNYQESNETNTTTNSETNTTTNTTTNRHEEDNSENLTVTPQTTGANNGDTAGSIDQNSISGGDGIANNNAIQADSGAGNIPQQSTPTAGPIVGDVNVGSPVVEGSTISPTVEGPLVGEVNPPTTVGGDVPPIENDSSINTQVGMGVVDSNMGAKIADVIIRTAEDAKFDPEGRWDEQANELLTNEGGGE